MLVGDSMNRNQFESILCLLWQGLPNTKRTYENHGYKITKGRGYYVFKFEVRCVWMKVICLVIHSKQKKKHSVNAIVGIFYENFCLVFSIKS